ncbi:MAG TPA: ABC transporter permease, partial [Nitrospirota bacterium]|nr:ABC transporter permease [Nitrospirota bacterium]
IREIKALVEAPQAVGIQVSPFILKVVNAAYYLFPNVSLFDIKTQAAHGIHVSASYLFWVIAYGIGYIIITILLAGFLFRRREFP